ncbi:hypothetical protein BDY19DRAFT_102283 [Irpex rosettiformis]|uniref:Uncharacterized protein n=1 Tax=Irpex rosettiformis TaxID=378272 RepID=A0ACB8U622_9APHY|nr:hypothetical protein BDY19DRAFT_102283 [Irpex rosettiformis]
MSTPEVEILVSSFHQLSITAVIFASLSALFGVYLVLFVLTVWATYRHPSVAQKRLRIVTIALFLTLVTHYTTRALEFGRARLITPPRNEQRLVDIPLLFVSTLTTSIACAISDGLLAWRFYNVFGRRRWALYIPAAAVLVNFLFGVTEDCLFLSFYHGSSAYYARMELYSFKMNIAWGWATFAINSIMTIAIMMRILFVFRSSSGISIGQRRVQHSVVLEAISESALVTWIGIVLLEIAELAPTRGHVSSNMNFGYVIDCILPIFFGISQCLITVRLSFASADRVTKSSNFQVSSLVCNTSNGLDRQSQESAATASTTDDTPEFNVEIKKEMIHTV